MNHILNFLIALLFGVVCYSCSSDEPSINEGNAASRVVDDDKDTETDDALEVSQLTQRTAYAIASGTLTQDMVKEVHDAVTTSLNYGLEEGYYFKEMLSSGNQNKVVRRNGKTPSTMGSLFNFASRAVANLTSGDLQTLSDDSYQIYWPYSENWDGETMPVITFTPEDIRSISNVAYYRGVNGIEQIVVDEEYAERNPVWIINKSDTPYDALPEIWTGEREKDGVIFGSPDITIGGGTPDNPLNPYVMTLKLGGFCATHQYDSWLAGGSEFDICWGYLNGGFQEDEKDADKYKTIDKKMRINRSRNDIKKGKWVYFKNCVLISKWYPNEEECFYKIIESDGGKNKNEDFELHVNLGKKTFGFSGKIPFKNHDEEIYQNYFHRDYILTLNTLERQLHDAYGVEWIFQYSLTPPTIITP